MKTAHEILHAAGRLIDTRGAEYDTPKGERSMLATVIAFNAITNRDLSEAEGWLLLQLLKDVRQWHRPGYHQDSGEDNVAYAALKAEALAREALVEKAAPAVADTAAPTQHIPPWLCGASSPTSGVGCLKCPGHDGDHVYGVLPRQ